MDQPYVRFSVVSIQHTDLVGHVLMGFPPGDKPGSGSEVAMNTVATLSKDVFEEHHEDRHNLEHPRPMGIMSRSGIFVSRPKSPDIAGCIFDGVFQSISAYYLRQQPGFTSDSVLEFLVEPLIAVQTSKRS